MTEPGRSTVLVIDDNEANRALAKAALEDEGHGVVLASSGGEGIEAFGRTRIDCVLLDVRMPGIDGFAVCQQLRRLPGGAEVPILFLTALRDVETFEMALTAGADDFLTKPVRPDELVARVDTSLKLRRMGRELREHAAVLRTQRDGMLRLHLQKERLMAFLVHDLKNPVSAMDLHAQFLLRDRGLSEDARASALQIRTEARRLNRMLLDLLDLSKADEGRLTPRPERVAIRPLFERVVAELAPLAEQREVTLRIEGEAVDFEVDADLMERMVANLVENAIRHAPARTTVRLEARAGAGGREVRVADAGKGIPAELRATVFDAFVQAPGGGVHRDAAGRGLGLAFCKLAAEAHGGRIEIEDGGPGATFSVRFPDDG
ncbi:MAG: hybrid sensor histidine kinase/response regulator [Polyangiaceae bacterium]